MMDFSNISLIGQSPVQMTVQEAIRTYCNHYVNQMLWLNVIILVGMMILARYRKTLEATGWGEYPIFTFEIIIVAVAMLNILVVLLP